MFYFHKLVRIVWHNIRLKFIFLKHNERIKKNSNLSSALIIGTGTSYLKFKDRLEDVVPTGASTAVIGLNNLIHYDRAVGKYLTDYVISYPGFFIGEINDEIIKNFSKDGDFSEGAARESLKACKKTIQILTMSTHINVWVPIKHFPKFAKFPNFKPYANISSMASRNQNDITQVIFGNDMVAFYAAAIARHYGATQLYSIGLDNNSFKTLNWSDDVKAFKYSYGHFYTESSASTTRYYHETLSSYFENISEVHKVHERYQIQNLDRDGISGQKS